MSRDGDDGDRESNETNSEHQADRQDDTSNEPEVKIATRGQKKNMCPFCGKAQTKITRHVVRKHKKEREVLKLQSLPVGSRERKQVVAALIHRGNFKHNCGVLRRGRGTIIPGRCPARSLNATHRYLLPCSACHGFFSRKNLYRHACNAEKGVRVQAASKALLPVRSDVCQGLGNVLKSMRDDPVGRICQNDPLIMEYGTRLYAKVGHAKHMHQYIREKMRELGRLLLKLKETSEADLRTYIHPSKFMDVTEAVRELTGAEGGRYNTPSLALKLGHSLAECAGLLKTTAIIEEDGNLKQATEDFLQLYKSEWCIEVSSRALGTLEERKWNRPDDLPRNEDVQKVTDALRTELTEAEERLKENPTMKNHANLSQAALASIILFNRRRPGETSRLTVEDYLKRDTSVNEEVIAGLSPMEQNLCRTLGCVVVRGKRGTAVPMMLTSAIQSALDLLVSSRDAVGISPENRYMFPTGVAGDAGTVRGSDAIRIYANKCGANNVTATKNRKHLATMLQLLQLSETELDIVAKFMGHDIRVHRQFYRLPDRTVYAGRVAKLLMATDQGIQTFVGSKLDDLDPAVGTSAADQKEEEAVTEDVSDDAPVAAVQATTSSSTTRPKRQRTPSAPPTTNPKRVCQKTVNSERETSAKKRVPWKPEERDVLKKELSSFIESMKCPGKAPCLTVIKNNALLSQRSWSEVKSCVYSMIQKQKRTVGLM